MPFRDPEQRREYAREWVAARRRAFFANKACTDCGCTTRLQLHHLDPAQKEGHVIWSWSAARREREIAKCVVLCARCHSKRHSPNPDDFGIWLRKSGRYKGLWEASISVGGARKWLGRYDTREAARRSYDQALREIMSS